MLCTHCRLCSAPTAGCTLHPLQAEHDVEARPILITPDAAVIAAVNTALQAQLAVLTTNAVAIPAVRTGFAVLVPDVATGVKVSGRTM